MESIIKFIRTRHLEGSALQFGDDGSDQVPYRKIAGRWVVVEEKADGANTGVSFDALAQQLLQSRGHYLTGGGREKHFDPFIRWAQAKDVEFYSVLGDRYIAYGEFMGSKHTEFYDHLPHLWLEFDLYDKQRQQFLSTKARRELLGQRLVPFSGHAGQTDAVVATNGTIVSVPVLFEGYAPKTLKEFLQLIKPSCAKTGKWREVLRGLAERDGLNVAQIEGETEDVDLMEGLYIKVEEGDLTVDRLKWVRPGFIQTISDNNDHWLSRPIIRNQLAPGIDIYAEDCGLGQLIQQVSV